MDVSEQTILELRTENMRLQKMVERDYLTGMYNVTGSEKLIDAILGHGAEGALLLIDIDHLRLVNEQKGHQMGDLVLRSVSELLSLLFFSRDILSRVDSDEFIVFSPSKTAENYLGDKGNCVCDRIFEIGFKMGLDYPLTATKAIVKTRKNDRFATLLSRARQDIKRKKNSRKNAEASRRGWEGAAIVRDISMIAEELREKEEIQGAYCQNYENFVYLYRFLKRGLARSTNSVYVVLLTLTDREGGLVKMESQEQLMNLLGETIRVSLRRGDVYTEYSGCQYLLMILDVTYENALMIVERIRKTMRVQALEYTDATIDCVIHKIEA